MEQRSFFSKSDLNVREVTAEQRIIEGYAITFNTLSVPLGGNKYSEIREIIAPSAATKAFLDDMDIQMTMFHDREILLARSNKGKGTLRYKVDSHGVWFEFRAPNTDQGDRAIEAVKRGDIAGCSFTFIVDYNDRAMVSESIAHRNGKDIVTYTVKQCDAIIEFTLTSSPAYNTTTVSARERQRLAREKARRLIDHQEARRLRQVAASIDASPLGSVIDAPIGSRRRAPMSNREKNLQLAKKLRTIADTLG